MKNKYDYKNIKAVRMSCNEWSCPANEGKGCQASDDFAMMCEINGADFDRLMEEAYFAMLKNQESYDEKACEIYGLLGEK